MKVRQIIEAIPNRPRSINYFRVRAQQLRQVQAAFEQAVPLLAKIDIPYELRYAAEDAGLTGVDSYELQSIGSALSNNYSGINPAEMAESLESYVKYIHTPGVEFWKYIPERLDFLTKSLERFRERFENFPTVAQVQEIVNAPGGYELLNPEYREPEEIQQVQQFIQLVGILSPALKNFLRIVDDLNQKVGAQVAHGTMMRAHEWERKPLRPEHQEVETLYHATAYANEVAANGFSAEKPADRRGVGNLGEQAEISFTHDLKIAMDIMRTLKEFALIANGQLKARTVADWIRRENIPNFPWHEFMRVYKGHNEFYSPQYEDTTFDRFSIEQTAELYQKYIWLSKIHPNPVIISAKELVRSMVGRPQSDIGIVACAVALDPNQSTYHPGESEFRVHPSAVQSIKRIM
jgi:hypothetical protein